MKTLRPYQNECVHAVFDAIEDGHNRVLYTQATGLGKTVTMAEIVRVLLEYRSDARGLILADRTEIITQTYDTVRAYCGLKPYEIGIEMGTQRAGSQCKIVVGSVQTVRSEKRFLGAFGWIITDEADLAAAVSYTKVYARYGVRNGDCLSIGCTATAKRLDKQCLYAIDITGKPVEIYDKKVHKKRIVTPEEAVFDKHCYDMNILDGVKGGWLVAPKGHAIATETDLSDIDSIGGKFNEAQLTEAVGVGNEKRNLQAVTAWKEHAPDRSTLVFSQGVAHAHYMAELFRAAGVSAAALDGDSDTMVRERTLADFRDGKIQVLCNDSLFFRGMDAPICSAILHMAPTGSWSRYVQKTGRGLRVLPGIIDDIQGIGKEALRLQAIACSTKPYCIIIDMVDICRKFELCSLPSILDLPANLDLEGNSVVEAKALLDGYADASEHLLDEGKAPPKTFRELKVRLEEVDLLRNSKSKSRPEWKATEHGFRFMGVPPGYTAELVKTSDVDFALRVRHQNRAILEKKGLKRDNMKDYLLEYGAVQAKEAIERHRKATQPAFKPPHGTVPITGNTWPIKDALKAMGGRWINGAWHVPQHRANEARALLSSAQRGVILTPEGVEV